jgi:hypothetical protein
MTRMTRHYNPGRGAFTQTDRVPMGAGSSFESAYVYGRNSPLVFVDPAGLRGIAVDSCSIPRSLALRSGSPNPYSRRSVPVKSSQKYEILVTSKVRASDVQVRWSGFLFQERPTE